MIGSERSNILFPSFQMEGSRVYWTEGNICYRSLPLFLLPSTWNWDLISYYWKHLRFVRNYLFVLGWLNYLNFSKSATKGSKYSSTLHNFGKWISVIRSILTRFAINCAPFCFAMAISYSNIGRIWCPILAASPWNTIHQNICRTLHRNNSSALRPIRHTRCRRNSDEIMWLKSTANCNFRCNSVIIRRFCQFRNAHESVLSILVPLSWTQHTWRRYQWWAIQNQNFDVNGVRSLDENRYAFKCSQRRYISFSLFGCIRLQLIFVQLFISFDARRIEDWAVSSERIYCIISFSYFMVFILLINHSHINRRYTWVPPTPRALIKNAQHIGFPLILSLRGMSPFCRWSLFCPVSHLAISNMKH